MRFSQRFSDSVKFHVKNSDTPETPMSIFGISLLCRGCNGGYYTQLDLHRGYLLLSHVSYQMMLRNAAPIRGVSDK